MSKKELELSRKQARLEHWQRRFNEKSVDGATRTLANNLLNDYFLRISKASLQITEDSYKEELLKLGEIERQLQELFNLRKLATSDIGSSVAVETSRRH